MTWTIDLTDSRLDINLTEHLDVDDVGLFLSEIAMWMAAGNVREIHVELPDGLPKPTVLDAMMVRVVSQAAGKETGAFPVTLG